MEFSATLKSVYNRGTPPVSFLLALLEWARLASDEIFAPNPNPADVYSLIVPILGPWTSLEHRRAAMLEVMRVHAGFESSWHWKEGVDVTNATSLVHKEGQETGIFQVSFDSTYLGHGAMKPYAEEKGIGTADHFIKEMKCNHTLAMDYYARLVRVSIAWAGPLKRKEVLPFLSKEAVTEFQKLY